MVRAAPSVVARRIRAIREAKGIGRQAFADALSVLLEEPLSRLQLWRVETGITQVSAELAGAAAVALGVPVGDLYVEAAA